MTIFTHHDEIIEIGTRLTKILCLVVIGDFIQGSQVGALLAMGYQDYGSAINIISYCVILLPMSYYLAFHAGYGVDGIFLGAVPGGLFASAAFLIIVFTTDWDKLSDNIHDRIDHEAQLVAHESSLLSGKI